MASAPPKCMACLKRVGKEARTTEGTYLCDDCARATAVWPTGKSERGNLYGGGTA